MNGTATCVGASNLLGPAWFGKFVAKQTNFDIGNITHKQFDDLVHEGSQQFDSFWATNDPDLSASRATGGKILGYHGMVKIFLLRPISRNLKLIHFVRLIKLLKPNLRSNIMILLWRWIQMFGISTKCSKLQAYIHHCSGGVGS